MLHKCLFKVEFESMYEPCQSFNVVERLSGSLNICSSVGDYEVSIRFNDEHIPDSPFIVPVASPSDDARRLTVASLQVRL